MIFFSHYPPAASTTHHDDALSSKCPNTAQPPLSSCQPEAMLIVNQCCIAASFSTRTRGCPLLLRMPTVHVNKVIPCRASRGNDTAAVSAPSPLPLTRQPFNSFTSAKTASHRQLHPSCGNTYSTFGWKHFLAINTAL